MTHKEIATRLNDALRQRDRADLTQAIKALRDELDPPRPAPGTVVWWQDIERLTGPALGQFNEVGMIEMFGTGNVIDPDGVVYKPARILASGEQLEQVTAERDRLREALREILTLSIEQPDSHTHDMAISVARAALQEDNDDTRTHR